MSQENMDFKDKYGTDFKNFRLTGKLPEDEEKERSVLKYAYHLAQANNHFPRVYHLGMILRDRIITDLETRKNQRGFWNKFKTKRLRGQLERIEDELYVINHLAPGHFVPFEKYDFMQKREEEGDKILEEAVKECLE